jgi:hypothetical protein
MSEGEMEDGEGSEEEQALAMTGVGGKIEASKVGPGMGSRHMPHRTA